MILLTKHLAFYLLIAFSHWNLQTASFNITVNIENLGSNDGKVLVGLYDSEGTFLKTEMLSEVAGVNDNTCTVTFKDVPRGTYAVSYVHDENGNGKMDKNFMGIPKEGYGCSNNAKGFMGPPEWEDAKFILNESIEITIN